MRFLHLIPGPLQGDKTRALTDVDSEKIDGSALKICGKVTVDILLQDRKKDQRDGDLAPVSPRHSGVFRLQRSHRRLHRIETLLTSMR